MELAEARRVLESLAFQVRPVTREGEPNDGFVALNCEDVQALLTVLDYVFDHVQGRG